MTKDSDYEEFAERINSMIDMHNITTRKDYLEAVSKALKFNPSLRQFSALWSAKVTNVNLAQEKMFKSAGGKDLDADKSKNAKTILTDVNEYRRRGSSKVDLKGLDTRSAFGFTTSQGRRVRVKIDHARTKIVTYPESYNRTLKSGRTIKVTIKNRDRLFIFNKKGRRLGINK